MLGLYQMKTLFKGRFLIYVTTIGRIYISTLLCVTIVWLWFTYGRTSKKLAINNQSSISVDEIHKCRLLYAKELKIRWNIWYTDSVRRHDCMEFIISAHFLIITIPWNRLKFVSWPNHDNWHKITMSEGDYRVSHET